MKFIKTASGKTLLSMLVFSWLVVIGIKLNRNFSQVRSVQAFVNGEISFLRASIPGELELNSEKIKLSNPLEKGTQIGTIKSTVENPRVSVLKIDKQQLETRLQDVQQQISGVKQQIVNRDELMKLFKQQTDMQKTLQRNYAHQQIKTV
jgi:hypothetical protein